MSDKNIRIINKLIPKYCYKRENGKIMTVFDTDKDPIEIEMKNISEIGGIVNE